jgi:hypothetical protein
METLVNSMWGRDGCICSDFPGNNSTVNGVLAFLFNKVKTSYKVKLLKKEKRETNTPLKLRKTL